MNLSDQPVTDIHCFAFGRTEFNRGSLAKLFMAGGPTVKSVRAETRAGDLGASVGFRRFIKELAGVLEVPGTEHEALAAREERAGKFEEYTELLFRDAKIERIAVDNGLEPVPFEEFAKAVPAKASRIFRVESLVKRLLDNAETFPRLLEMFTEEIEHSVSNGGYVGFKTVIAYRTGLDIGPPDERAARESFDSGREDRAWFGPKVKAVRDYLIHRTAEVASKRGAFLEIHTGLGDTDIVADRCNPLLLQRFLKDETVMKTPIVLIHGGFPYTKEAAWLCSMFPNLYFELSSPFPPTFLPAVSKARFGEILEVVPTTRIVYGSDAIETPEFHWYSAKLAKRALAASLGELVGEGIMTEEDAYEAADMVMNRNASGLLG
ncbi:MAG: amidohydrolase family protein [Thaumarchaeota archaeon]|nr:amidohydrolase family protein [Nitrososphaerota archaeon]